MGYMVILSRFFQVLIISNLALNQSNFERQDHGIFDKSLTVGGLNKTTFPFYLGKHLLPSIGFRII